MDGRRHSKWKLR